MSHACGYFLDHHLPGLDQVDTPGGNRFFYKEKEGVRSMEIASFEHIDEGGEIVEPDLVLHEVGGAGVKGSHGTSKSAGRTLKAPLLSGL
jgi:hypothetical protein